MSWFDVSKDTLIRWCKANYGCDFATIYEQKKEGGKIALRRYQLQLAEKNPTMAIWLGKQYLKQRDNIEVEHDAQNGILGDLIGALNKAKGNNAE